MTGRGPDHAVRLFWQDASGGFALVTRNVTRAGAAVNGHETRRD